MSKKRKGFRKIKVARHRRKSRSRKVFQEVAQLDDTLLSSLYSATKPVPLKKLTTSPGLKSFHPDLISQSLDRLIGERLIKKDGRSSFSLNQPAPIYKGTLELNPRGFGFVSTDNQGSAGRGLKKDIFISASRLGNSSHGDKVLVRVLHVKKNGRPEGRVLRVVSQATDTVAGTYAEVDGKHYVYPDDPRFPFVVRLNEPKINNLAIGYCVIAKYKRTEQPAKVHYGKITEILGPQEAIKTQMRLVIEKLQLPSVFSQKVQQEVKEIHEDFSKLKGREDLRHTDHITIDGETAKDFDDAIFVTQRKNGYRLFVSIADVSHFVTQGSSLDKEAYLRGTSIYFPDSVIPMLPEKLSNDMCSLKPDLDRYTVSAILDFDDTGNLQKRRFCRSIIRSQKRLTYTAVGRILLDKDPAARKQHKRFLAQLELAKDLAEKLKFKRRERGAVEFDLIEPDFTLSPSGEIVSISPVKRTKAHQIIEEFMLAANEAVADFFSSQNQTALYRIHEAPDQEKLDDFLRFAETLDLILPQTETNSRFLVKILEQAKGSKYEFIVNNLLLRSLQQARYSTQNFGHFGLASPHYTHFTSPIRRYPDLLVHRQLLSLISQDNTTQPFTPSPPIAESAEFLSSRERQAVLAEREMNSRLKTLYMSKYIGDRFDAIISGVSENTLYIEIQALCVSGSISVDYLTDDYYLYDAKNYRLFGEITARTYQIGDPIQVILLEADLSRQQLRFKPA